MSAFIQITDTHIVPDGTLAYGRSDTAAALRAAVATINAALPHIGPVDCAIITGDLADHGTAGEYAHLRDIMADLALPYLAIPGNHDRRAPMRAAFAGTAWMPATGPIQWRRDFDGFTVVALDTLVEGSDHGALSDEGLAYLTRQIVTLDGQALIVATHHPWMHSGIRAMDADNLRNGAALLDLLEGYSGPARMISGHVHRTLSTQIGRVTCQIAPAPCHAVHLNHHPGTAASLIMEPGGVTLWTWQARPVPGLVSDVIPVGRFDGPWPFDR